MAANENELEFEFLPYIRVYKNGNIVRLKGEDTIPAGTDPHTGVSSKDVTNIIPETEVYVRIYVPKISTNNQKFPLVSSKDVTNIIPETEVYVRIYVPKISTNNQKFPLLVYYHGGAFLVQTPSSPTYHNYLNALVAKSQVIAVSVHYRRAPEHHLPAAYEDSWAALHWVASHCNGDGPEAMLNHHADFRRVFLGGDSAGGNIVHNLAMAAGNPDGGLNVGILGIALVDPFFWGSDPIEAEELDSGKKAYVDRLWGAVCPSCPLDDPWINPLAEGGPSLVGLGCWRVLVTVAEKDLLKDRGWLYFQVLSRSGWLGAVEIDETEGEEHCFHLDNLESEKAKERMRKMADFFNRDLPPMAFQ